MEVLPAYEDCVTKAFEQLDLKVNPELEHLVQQTLAAIDKEMRDISLKIYDLHELSMKEQKSHDLLTAFLEEKGFQVTRHAYGMDTAFTAEFGNGPGRRVGVCSEYDGLPGLGQGCGHNLICISGIAVAMALKAALEQNKISGKVILFGTPGEEMSAGKIEMVKQRAFQDNVDACVMLHPSPMDGQYAKMIAVQHVNVEFIGKPTHASSSPWEGINALDAMVQLWNGVSMMRQQLEPTDRVHGIVTDGGQAPNIIPEHTSAMFFVRTYKYQQLKRVMEKMEQCFEGAALATGCQVKWEWADIPTKDVVQNHVMASTYAHYMEKTGITFPDIRVQEGGGGSTDMGNVSYVVPSIHPMYGIHTTASNHTVEFTKAARTIQAHRDTMNASKCLALTALELFNDRYFDAVKKDFETTVPEDERN
ncbi:hypothetical protein DM01DRAFT_253439 [Hesseltinella vesiculosa]|uniref:Peptidase M20 domain-containing protein 2 n=1 Tax=Hesseltinella vesiculosa TaxID=101127 RepID=A0A1X2GLY9_9FUNG|nr:hypothetical protein DM01DRAFT_253439 [Hesseltinella vesiculosa]